MVPDRPAHRTVHTQIGRNVAPSQASSPASQQPGGPAEAQRSRCFIITIPLLILGVALVLFFSQPPFVFWPLDFLEGQIRLTGERVRHFDRSSYFSPSSPSFRLPCCHRRHFFFFFPPLFTTFAPTAREFQRPPQHHDLSTPSFRHSHPRPKVTKAEKSKNACMLPMPSLLRHVAAHWVLRRMVSQPCIIHPTWCTGQPAPLRCHLSSPHACTDPSPKNRG